MSQINTDFPWFKWEHGAVPAFEKCLMGERGLLIVMAGYYWKYRSLPEDLARGLDLEPGELEGFFVSVIL